MRLVKKRTGVASLLLVALAVVGVAFVGSRLLDRSEVRAIPIDAAQRDATALGVWVVEVVGGDPTFYPGDTFPCGKGVTPVGVEATVIYQSRNVTEVEELLRQALDSGDPPLPVLALGENRRDDPASNGGGLVIGSYGVEVFDGNGQTVVKASLAGCFNPQ